MSYRIEFQPKAIEEIDSAYDWIAKDSRTNAERWLERLARTLQTLTENPERCPLAHENKSFAYEVRELLFGRRRGVYRILFTIRGDTVQVLRFRHGARRFLDE